MPIVRSPGRPRGALPEPEHTLTARVRHLIDIAHDGKLGDASRLTGIPYPTLNDLYVGRSVSPNLATLERLRRPYGIDLSWLLAESDPVGSPRTGIAAHLPPDPRATLKRRALRKIQIPYVAWSMYEVFTTLETKLGAIEASADRPVVGEASGDALRFRLATFLFQPLLAAEKAGESDVFVLADESGGAAADKTVRWRDTLTALGAMWIAALPGLLRDPGTV